MTTRTRLDPGEAPSLPERRRRAIAVAIASGLAAGPALAGSSHCTETASRQYEACRYEVKDDFATAFAICGNTSDKQERSDCYDEARTARGESNEECGEQREAREDLCDELGEDRYDPEFDPADFDTDFANLTHPNPWFPLGIGNRWRYAGGEETIEIEVLDETKRIEGVTCIVVRDVARENDTLVEDTEDWFGQRKNGSIDYCGEISRNFESFEGDDPAHPELVDVEGSWKAGRDGARSGTLFPGSPDAGQVYRQEWAPGSAEDAARVLSTRYGYGNDAELDAFVPAALAALLCDDEDCVVTAEFTPLDPDAFERKYYARGIGLFLEVAPESGEIVQLVECNVDPKCASLPTP
jgi:hypothetical protein